MKAIRFLSGAMTGLVVFLVPMAAIVLIVAIFYWLGRHIAQVFP